MTRSRGLRSALILLAVIGVIAGGLGLRRWAWDASEQARYPGDVRNAFRWGRVANRVGYLDLYRRQEPNAVENKNDQLDYPPLRLFLMARWQAWAHTVFPKARTWQRQYELTAPLLRLNSAFELASALGAFLLVTLWHSRRELRTSGAEVPPGWVRTPGGLRRGALAALLLWLNPAVIWDAHCWPQWDVWVVAIFLFAALFASLGWWWAVGFLLGFGALLKGQTLLILPFFLLWLLFDRRFAAAGRIALGFITMIAFAGSLWLLGSFANGFWEINPFAVRWLARATAAALLLFPWPGLAFSRYRAAALGAAALLLLAPGGAGGSVLGWLAVAAALTAAWFLKPRPARQAWPWAAVAAAAALALCVPLFTGDLAWVRIGWLYGSHHYPMLRKGRALNLPALLEVWFPQWQGRLLPGVRLALVAAYAAGLAACARTAARATRTADPRLLACLAAPWVLLYAVMPQMHERYFVFAAAITAAPAVLIPEFLLLHFAITGLSLLAMIPLKLLPAWLIVPGGDLRQGVSWMAVLCAAASLAVALRRRREPASPALEDEAALGSADL